MGKFFNWLLILCILQHLSVFKAWAETNPKIKIGVSAPLSGDIAEYGVAVKNGIQIARQQNSELFEALEFIYEDNQYDAARSISILNKFIETDKIDVMYLWGEPPLNAVAPIVEKRHLPVVAMSIDASPAVGAKYIIRSINHPLEYSKLMLSYLRSRRYAKLGLVTVEDPFINALVSALEAQKLPAEEIEIFQNVLPGEKDYRTAVARMNMKDYDAIGVYLLPGQASTFLRQAKDFLSGRLVFGTDVFESRTEITAANGAMENAIFPAVIAPAEFEAEYLRRFGNDSQLTYAYNAFIFARRSAEIFSSLSKNAKPAEIISAYLKPDPQEIYKVRQDPRLGAYFEFKLSLQIIRGGKFESFANS